MTSRTRTRFRLVSSFPLLLTAAITVLLGAGILRYPAACAEGIRNGLTFCGQTLIPSLFPFMVLSAFVVKSGLSAKISRFLEPVTRFLFHLPGCTAATILIGLIGGYPAGARGIKALIERGDITVQQGERMLCFAVGAGPAFVISVVGGGLLGNGKAGLILFVSQTLGAVLIGVVSGLFSRHSAEPTSNRRQAPQETPPLSSALVESAADSTNGLINMCSFVILFSAILMLVQACGLSDWLSGALIAIGIPQSAAQSMLSIFLEVSGGCTQAALNGASPMLISFALGWAGACVHFQISASLKSIRFSKAKFTLFRFLHGLLAALISFAGFRLFPDVAETFSTVSSPAAQASSSSASGSIMLVIVCIAFLLTFGARSGFRHKKVVK